MNPQRDVAVVQQCPIMELLVLGSSGSVAGPHNAASGYLVRSAGTDVLTDCGPGVLAALQRQAANPVPGTVPVDPSVCHVVFSHMHADHCLDFPSLLVWRRFHPTDPAQGVHRLLGPEMAKVHLSRAGADYLDIPDDFSDTFEVSAFVPGTGPFNPERYPAHPMGSLTFYAAEAVHTTESYLMRIHDDTGRSLVYTGDTAPTENLQHLAAGADVLLCEATWGENGVDKPAGMHLSGEDAGRAAAEAGVGLLVLTHIPPWGDVEATVRGAHRFFDGEIRVAEPGMLLNI